LASKKTSTKDSDIEFVERASKALVTQIRSYYSTGTLNNKPGAFELLPDYDLKMVLKLIRADSTAWAAVNTLLDRVIERGWEVVDADTRKRLPATEVMLKNKDFDQWLREMMLHYIVFNNAFGELVYSPNGFGVRELHTLNPTDVKIRSDEHGDILEYYMDTGGENSVLVSWSPEEVLHIADPSFELNAWGEIQIKSIANAIILKQSIRKLMLWLFQTNQFRPIFNPKGASTEQITRSIVYLKESQNNINKPLIFEGEFDFKTLREFNDLEVLNKLIYKLDEEILNLLQVPPIYAGLPDNSNRSNSDAQERSFNTRVRSIQKTFESYFPELLKRMSVFKSELLFRPVTMKSEKEVLENVLIMQQLNFKPEEMVAYLRSHGFDLESHNPFKDEEVEDSNNPTTNYVDEQFMPSRQRKGVDEGNEKIGTGEEGTTREDQLVTRTFPFFVQE
jgi:hypothetical protein